MDSTEFKMVAAALAMTGTLGAVAVAFAQPGGPGMGRGMMGGGMGRGMGMGGMNTVQVPADNPITPEKVELGKQLYFDPRLSKDGTVSCNSCHDLAAGGADPKPVSTGVGGAQGTRNSPTVWNSAFHNAQFWDGRAPSLEEQAKGPLVNPVEMAMPNYDAVVAVVKGIPGYVRQFDQVFGKDAVNIDNIAKAIATYERTLVSRNSKFDNFRFTDKGALTQEEWSGFRTFRMAGCMECHMGPDFSGPPPLARGDGFYQKFPRFPDSSLVAQYKLLNDGGRYNVTKQENDRHVYRVPTLRNVAATAPYFHNGKVPTLAEAAKVCAKGGSNRDLSAAEVKSLVAFLEALTGEMPVQKPPKLP
jgi:cytochrome c peroxidase